MVKYLSSSVLHKPCVSQGQGLSCGIHHIQFDEALNLVFAKYDEPYLKFGPSTPLPTAGSPLQNYFQKLKNMIFNVYIAILMTLV